MRRTCVLGLVAAAGLAQAEPFVFQGSLNDGGAPAEGTYDLQFFLYDAEIGGTQIGSTNTLDDIEVSNGAFAVELDFGDDAFDGSDRWVAIVVRDGDSTGTYTPLNPRAKIGNAPQASYANQAGEAATLSDPFWTQAPGILFFGEDEGDDQVFINRNRDIENSDIFVVHSSMNGLGGMTISTWANGMPYYGYATGGFSRAKTYYDPVTDAWVVSKNGQDLLEIDQNDDVVITNNLIVNGTITSMGNGGGGGTIIGYKTFTPDSIFRSFSFDRAFNAFAGAIEVQGTSGYLRMDLDLPHGVVITNIHVEYVDRSSSSNLRFELWKRDRVTLDYSEEVLGTSNGFDLNMVQVMDIVPNPAIVIDNTECTYGFRAFSTSSTWPAAGNLGIRNVLVEYEQTLP
ncbi:MAG: hypothetical protein ACF8LL_01295 [Phycisphaerales bacterium]